MADAAIARREARRRRILENSQNRLQLISGKIDDDSCKDSPRRIPIPDQNVELPDIKDNTTNTCLLNNGVIESEFETFTTFTVSGNMSDDRELTNPLAAFGASAPEPTSTQNYSLIDKLVTNQYDIVLLSLIIQLLYGLSIFTFEKTYFFLPLILYVLTKLVFFPKENNLNIANALLLLNGVSAEKVNVILNILQLIMIISRDVCVFLFTTICIQYVCIILKGYLIT